ncbi:Acg family FMN-binding oxidoreductase [Streptomyces sp. NPDC058293]|uniref:Acg family FMN-binding oxidoreductase n=1 Tax=Streptomyces sp. NPDC058293 TaxID=3346429 RepID=UPI0036EB7884
MSAQPLETVAVASLIEDAVTAPSMHNAQPWRFVCRPSSGTVELYGDSTRTMPHTDPNHRALHLGCAASLFNLRVAAVRAGREPVVRLLPDPHDPWFLAEVHLREPTAALEAQLALFHPALRRRHTSRFPFTDEEIPAPILDGLRAAALLEECKLMLPDAWHTEAVLDLVHDSENREGSNPAVREETAAWTRTGAPGEGPATEGIPAYAFGPRQSGMSAPVRDFGSWRPVMARDSAVFEKHPRIALLGTSGDTPTDWMKAGQALQRILLQATQDGLVTSMTSQPLEWPELRWAVRDPSDTMGHVHMVIRLGYGPQGPATPRRPAQDVLTVV